MKQCILKIKIVKTFAGLYVLSIAYLYLIIVELIIASEYCIYIWLLLVDYCIWVLHLYLVIVSWLLHLSIAFLFGYYWVDYCSYFLHSSLVKHHVWFLTILYVCNPLSISSDKHWVAMFLYALQIHCQK